jgi:hypothetical protein
MLTARRALKFGHLKTGFSFVPEGHAIVARRFIAGVRDPMACVPEGRLNRSMVGGIFHLEPIRRAGMVATRIQLQAFKRPSGTQILLIANPAINRRATIACPSGTKGKPARRAHLPYENETQRCEKEYGCDPADWTRLTGSI